MKRCPECNKIYLPNEEEENKIIKNALKRLKSECNFGVRPLKGRNNDSK
jgi:hypothetical protein